MAEIRLTKQSLRQQQMKLYQLQEYLPTLQLKKSMLQFEIQQAKSVKAKLDEDFDKAKSEVLSFAKLLSGPLYFDIFQCIKIQHIQKHYENIAGVEIPVFDKVTFADVAYFLFETPAWIDYAIIKLRHMISIKEHIQVTKEKIHALEKEMHDVSIRVNLFEKILIPRSLKNIRKIKIFLGDLELAAVAQAKMAKCKIEAQRL